MLEHEDTPEADARLENLREFIGSMDDFQHHNEEQSALAGFLESVTLKSDNESLERFDYITLMTVHAAKGLEFPVVFTTGLEEGMFPYKGIEPWDNPDELSEERRLAYVAFTRAEERLILSYANQRRLFGTTRPSIPSRFIRELPPDDINEIQTYWAAQHTRLMFRSSVPQQSTYSNNVPRYIPKQSSRESYIDRSEFIESSDSQMLRRGMKVRHTKFGVGKVTEVSYSVPPKATVAFVDWGIKQIVINYLEPL